MKLRAWGIVTLILLVAALSWTLRPRGSQSEPVAPTPARIVEKQIEASLDPTATAIPVRESAQPAPIAEAHTKHAFALVKVLVVNKATQAPLPGIDVDCFSKSKENKRANDVLVITDRSHGVPFERLRTDVDGRVEIEVPPGAQARVDATGKREEFGSDLADIPPLNAGEVHEVTLHLPTLTDMPFWMQFVDEVSHMPIEGVRVGPGSSNESKLTSDAQGLALWPGRREKPGMLQVDAEGYARSYLKPVLGHAESSSPFVVTLSKCANVDVHVVDASNQAIVGAQVDLVTNGYGQSTRSGNSIELISVGDPHWQGVTDLSGHAKITCVPPHVAIRAGVLSPRKWDASDKLVLEPGETRELEWMLMTGCDVRGVVLDQSNVPVRQREMWLCTSRRKSSVYFDIFSSGAQRSAKTDEQGRFRFDDVGTGTWRLGPSAPADYTKIADDDVAAFAQVVEIAEGQSDLDLTIHVDRGLFIRGTVMNAKGEPIKDGFVQGNDMARRLSTHTRGSSRDNSYALGPLMAGHYVLTALGQGGDADSDPVEADAGSSNVVLRMREGASFSGTVTAPSGELVAAEILVTLWNANWSGIHGVNCGNDGAFQIRGLEAGTYDISAHTSDGATGLLEGVAAVGGESQKALDIQLIPGGHVRVRHEGPDDNISIRVLAHGVTVAVGGLERSTTHELAAPAGTVNVQASYDETEKRVVERTVEVKAGQTVDVVFEKDAK